MAYTYEQHYEQLSEFTLNNIKIQWGKPSEFLHLFQKLHLNTVK